VSTDKGIVIIVVCSIGVLVCAWQIRRALREPLERDLIVAAARRRAALVHEVKHDVGPDSLRLLEDLDAHLDQQYARLSGLYERIGPPPGNGIARLLHAVRDEQQEGESA
jgi:hypothetical protein